MNEDPTRPMLRIVPPPEPPTLKGFLVIGIDPALPGSDRTASMHVVTHSGPEGVQLPAVNDGRIHMVRNNSDKPIQIFGAPEGTIELPVGEQRLFIMTQRRRFAWKAVAVWTIFALTMFAVAWVATR